MFAAAEIIVNSYGEYVVNAWRKRYSNRLTGVHMHSHAYIYICTYVCVVAI